MNRRSFFHGAATVATAAGLQRTSSGADGDGLLPHKETNYFKNPDRDRTVQDLFRSDSSLISVIHDSKRNVWISGASLDGKSLWEWRLPIGVYLCIGPKSEGHVRVFAIHARLSDKSTMNCVLDFDPSNGRIHLESQIEASDSRRSFLLGDSLYQIVGPEARIWNGPDLAAKTQLPLPGLDDAHVDRLSDDLVFLTASNGRNIVKLDTRTAQMIAQPLSHPFLTQAEDNYQAVFQKTGMNPKGVKVKVIAATGAGEGRLHAAVAPFTSVGFDVLFINENGLVESTRRLQLGYSFPSGLGAPIRLFRVKNELGVAYSRGVILWYSLA